MSGGNGNFEQLLLQFANNQALQPQQAPPQGAKPNPNAVTPVTAPPINVEDRTNTTPTRGEPRPGPGEGSGGGNTSGSGNNLRNIGSLGEGDIGQIDVRTPFIKQLEQGVLPLILSLLSDPGGASQGILAGTGANLDVPGLVPGANQAQGLSNFLLGGAPAQGLARGGPLDPNAFSVVGEQGPELIPPGNQEVIPLQPQGAPLGNPLGGTQGGNIASPIPGTEPQGLPGQGSQVTGGFIPQINVSGDPLAPQPQPPQPQEAVQQPQAPAPQQQTNEFGGPPGTNLLPGGLDPATLNPAGEFIPGQGQSLPLEQVLQRAREFGAQGFQPGAGFSTLDRTQQTGFSPSLGRNIFDTTQAQQPAQQPGASPLLGAQPPGGPALPNFGGGQAPQSSADFFQGLTPVQQQETQTLRQEFEQLTNPQGMGFTGNAQFQRAEQFKEFLRSRGREDLVFSPAAGQQPTQQQPKVGNANLPGGSAPSDGAQTSQNDATNVVTNQNDTTALPAPPQIGAGPDGEFAFGQANPSAGPGAIQNFLQQQAPESQAFNQAQKLLGGEGGILSGQNSGQAIIDALQPIFDRNVQGGLTQLQNSAPSVFGSGFGQAGGDVVQRALQDFNLLGSQALQQGQQTQLGGLGVLGQLAGQAGQNPFQRLLGAGQLAQGQQSLDQQQGQFDSQFGLTQQQQQFNQAIQPLLALLQSVFGFVGGGTGLQTVQGPAKG